MGFRRRPNDLPSMCEAPLGAPQREPAEMKDLTAGHDDVRRVLVKSSGPRGSVPTLVEKAKWRNLLTVTTAEGTLTLEVPRGRVRTATGTKEFRSEMLPRYARRR